jgi:hypothetical protein
MTDFADHLFEDLMAEHGAALTSAAGPAPAYRRYARPAWATAGTVAAAGAAAVGFTLFGGTAAAYAVTDNHDGTVTVTVTKAGGISGANTTLHKMGANVVVVKATPGCPSIDSFAVRDQNVGKTTDTVSRGADGETTIKVQAQGLPKKETMLIAFDFDHPMQRMSSVLVHDPVPACVSLPALPADRPTGFPSGLQVHTDGSGNVAVTDKNS